MASLINPNPTVYDISEIRRQSFSETDEDTVDEFDSLEVFGNFISSLSYIVF